ncbi:MAG: c-type cytochrome domain-containing protein [Ferruginibacter sp.]
MKKYFFALFVVIVLIVAFNACTHDPGTSLLIPPLTVTDSVTGGEQSCSADTVYFQNAVLPLLISSCAKSNCHDAASHQDGIQLTSYQMIMLTADVDPGDPGGSKLYRVLNETDPDKIMPRPPSNPFTQAEKDIIYKWILQGAKNNSCNDCDTTTATWSGAVLPMINNNCKGCHNPSFLSAGLDLTNFASVQTIAFNGKLMGSIDHLPGFPPMPRGASKLNDCKITQVRKWIETGALNN